MSDSSSEVRETLIVTGALLLLAMILRRPRGKGTHGGVAAALLEPGRGRFARRPGEIPKRGWKDILIRVYKSLGEDRLLTEAGAVTFFGLLAVFPAIGALVSIFGIYADRTTIAQSLDLVTGFLPAGAIEVIRDQMVRVASEPSTTLGLGAIFGLLISLWSANSGIKALFDALNVVYDEKEKRGFFKLNAISLTFTICAIAFLLISVTALAVLPAVLKYLPLRDVSHDVVHLLRWPCLFIAIVFALSLVYRYGPSRDRPRWQWVSWGSVIAGALWLGASALFSWYAANFGNYNETYGSLGAVIGFMMWLWISAIVILLGGEINAEMEHQTVRDTTVGVPAPLGTRGATMADTVGAAQG
jgi:membrane protein